MGLLQPHERHRRRHGRLPLTASPLVDRGPEGPEPAKGPGRLRGPFLRVYASRDIARIAAVSRALDRAAVVVSDGAVGWPLFAAMVHAAEPGDTALTFLYDAGEQAGAAAEALRAGAPLVLSGATPAQRAGLAELAAATGAVLLEELSGPVLDSPDVEGLKAVLLAADAEAARSPEGGG